MKNCISVNIVLLSLLVMTMAQVSCKKGDMGPQGPPGEQGEKGDKGDAGDRGSDGDPGTANVIYSDWGSVTFASSGGVYSGTIDAPKLTQDLLNSGGIAVYERTLIGLPPATATYSKLPYSNGSKWIKVDLEVGKIILRSNVNSISSYRYVLIPGGMQASATFPFVFEDYTAVRDFFSLQE